jgi:hypothetical protein
MQVLILAAYISAVSRALLNFIMAPFFQVPLKLKLVIFRNKTEIRGRGRERSGW